MEGFEQLIERNPEILGGTPVFAGTRVPVRVLFTYLILGKPLDEFLDCFPSVSHQQAVNVIELAQAEVLPKAS